MIPCFLQFAAVAAVAFFLFRWREGVRNRNAQSWSSLLAELRRDWSARALNGNLLWEESLDATPVDAWQRMDGPRGLWVIFQNAKVMMQMADYADRSCESVDRLLLETLRSDAVQIRVCVLLALAQYAFSYASDGFRINSFRAATIYSGMAARMARLIQENAAVVLPDFVAAM
jgi:hypothetical protein